MIVKITVKAPVMRDGTRVFWVETDNIDKVREEIKGLPVESVEIVG
jgi:hypothetical protein